MAGGAHGQGRCERMRATDGACSNRDGETCGDTRWTVAARSCCRLLGACLGDGVGDVFQTGWAKGWIYRLVGGRVAGCATRNGGTRHAVGAGSKHGGHASFGTSTWALRHCFGVGDYHL